jgi:hypothetical protein
MEKEIVMTQVKLAPVLALIVPLLLVAIPGASAHDELYYSAAACVPVNASHFNGSGAQGFQFTNVGTWSNYDDNDTQILICPVPYFRDTANLDPIVVRVVIDDFNLQVFARAFLCGRDSASGAQHCVNADNFPTIYGNSFIELSLTPTSNTRFVWLEVHIPPDADDNNGLTPDATSGLVGYRIFRN